jgi:hypothetical protein
MLKQKELAAADVTKVSTEKLLEASLSSLAPPVTEGGGEEDSDVLISVFFFLFVLHYWECIIGSAAVIEDVEACCPFHKKTPSSPIPLRTLCWSPGISQKKETAKKEKAPGERKGKEEEKSEKRKRKEGKGESRAQRGILLCSPTRATIPCAATPPTRTDNSICECPR